jgi:hypothetical protein
VSEELVCDALPSPISASGKPGEEEDLLLTSLVASQTDSVSFLLKGSTYGRFFLGLSSSGSSVIFSGRTSPLSHQPYSNSFVSYQN